MSTRPRTVAPVATPVQHRRLNPSTQRDGTASVSTTIVRGREQMGSTNRSQVVDAVRFAEGEEPAFVRVGLGETIPTVQFGGVRIDIAVTLPCLPEDVPATYERAQGMAEEFLADQKQRMGV